MKKYCFLILTVLCLLALLSGCSDSYHIDAKGITEDFINAVIEDDYQSAREFFSDTDKASFDEFYGKISQSLGETKSYTLKQNQMSYVCKNGSEYNIYVFEMTTDTDSGYVVKTYFNAGGEEIYAIEVLPKAGLSSREILPFRYGAWIITLLEIGFCVWMIIDCARRNMRKKWLWILIILCGFSVAVTFGYSFGINFGVVFALPFCSASADSMTTTLKLSVPLGAIIYFILRGKLTIKPPYIEVEYKDL